MDGWKDGRLDSIGCFGSVIDARGGGDWVVMSLASLPLVPGRANDDDDKMGVSRHPR